MRGVLSDQVSISSLRHAQGTNVKSIHKIINEEEAVMEKNSVWKSSRIRSVAREYTLISDGILGREDYNILFENGTGKRYIPKETAEAVNIYSDVVFSSGFFRFMDKSGISVNLFDKYGRYSGTFMPSESPNSGKTLLRQAALYLNEEKRTEIARAIELAALHNIRANLKYYGRRKAGGFKEVVKELDNIYIKMEKAGGVNKLMLLEAEARRIYYGMFNAIMGNGAFTFTVRTRRPPMDPVNALVSFGNMCLYGRIATEIAKTSLDVRIGFLHATGDRSMSLNLDIAELFKPVIVDRSIFTLVNKGMLDGDRHFRRDPENGGVFLNTEGKGIFLKELETKLNLSREAGGRSMTYMSRIKAEIGKINKTVMTGEVYKPYRYVD